MTQCRVLFAHHLSFEVLYELLSRNFTSIVFFKKWTCSSMFYWVNHGYLISGNWRLLLSVFIGECYFMSNYCLHRVIVNYSSESIFFYHFEIHFEYIFGWWYLLVLLIFRHSVKRHVLLTSSLLSYLFFFMRNEHLKFKCI